MLVACLIVATILSSVASARPRRMRVDSDRIDIPKSLEPAWNDVLAHRDWNSTEHGDLGDNARFSRFLPRSYELKRSGGNLLLITRWTDEKRCLTTERNTSSIEKKRKAALEAALGVNLTELANADEDAAVPQQKFVVLWCQFRTAAAELLPLTSLVEADQQLLEPFADLARAHLETSTGRNRNCEPQEFRPGAGKDRSSGRRPRSSMGGPVPMGGATAGPSAVAGRAPARPQGSTRKEDERDQRYAVLVEEFRAVPGSLEFQKVREFTRCIPAASSAEALSRARSAYPATVRTGAAQRVSYRVSLGGSCGDQTDASGTGSEDVPTENLDDAIISSGDPDEGAPASNLDPEPDPIGDETNGPMGGDDPSNYEGFEDPYVTEDIPYPDDYGAYESTEEEYPELSLDPAGPMP
jgi:hypothetical protein